MILLPNTRFLEKDAKKPVVKKNGENQKTAKEVIKELESLKLVDGLLPYSVVANMFQGIESLSARLEIIEIIKTLFLKTLELCPTVSFLFLCLISRLLSHPETLLDKCFVFEHCCRSWLMSCILHVTRFIPPTRERSLVSVT